MKKKILAVAISMAVFSASATFAMEENKGEPGRNPPPLTVNQAPVLPVNPAPLFGADGELLRNAPSIIKSFPDKQKSPQYNKFA